MKLTPMMQQYVAAKEKYPDALLMFRLGDFYELFFDDARIASRVLGLTLTSRGTKVKTRFRWPAYRTTRRRATSAASRTKATRSRSASRLKSPAKRNVSPRGEPRRHAGHGVRRRIALGEVAKRPRRDRGAAAGLATIDVSTGRFSVTAHDDLGLIGDELLRLSPRELYHTDDARFAPLLLRLKKSRLVAKDMAPAEADPASAAIAVCMAAVAEALPIPPQHIGAPERHVLTEHLLLDETSRRNLELTQTLIGGKREGSLLHHIDRTRTGMGARLLCQWLTAPLVSRERILERQAVVGHFVERPTLRDSLSSVLERLYDLERLNGRLGAQQATPRDLGSLRDTLALLPEVKALPWRSRLTGLSLVPARLNQLSEQLGDFSALVAEAQRRARRQPARPAQRGGDFSQRLRCTDRRAARVCRRAAKITCCRWRRESASARRFRR